MRYFRSGGRCHKCSEPVLVLTKVQTRAIVTVKCVICKDENNFFLDEAIKALEEEAKDSDDPQSASPCRSCGEPAILFSKVLGRTVIVVECNTCEEQSSFPVDEALMAVEAQEVAARIATN